MPTSLSLAANVIHDDTFQLPSVWAQLAKTNRSRGVLLGGTSICSLPRPSRDQMLRSVIEPASFGVRR
jgi:hypothetical protein